MERVVAARPLSGYRIEMEFSDGLKGEVCLADRLFGPVFEPLQDPEGFGEVRVDEFGALCRPNGADLAPDAMCQTIAKNNRG